MTPDDFAAILAARFPPVCGFQFDNGNYCHAGEAHPVHHSKWHGPEPNHDYIRETVLPSEDNIVSLAPLLLDLWRAGIEYRAMAGWPGDGEARDAIDAALAALEAAT